MEFEMPEIGEFDWKIVLIVVALVAIIVLALIFTPSLGGPVNSYFKPSNQFEKNSEGTLIVEVRNTMDKDLIQLTVSAEAIDPNNIQISNFQQNQSYVGKGEIKKFEFPIQIENTRAGTYTIEIKAKLDNKIFNQRTMLEVK